MIGYDILMLHFSQMRRLLHCFTIIILSSFSLGSLFSAIASFFFSSSDMELFFLLSRSSKCCMLSALRHCRFTACSPITSLFILVFPKIHLQLLSTDDNNLSTSGICRHFLVLVLLCALLSSPLKISTHFPFTSAGLLLLANHPQSTCQC